MNALTAAALRPFGAFLHWWLSELASLVPAPVERLLARARGGAIVVRWCPDTLVPRQETAGETRSLAIVDPGSDQAGQKALEALRRAGQLRWFSGQPPDVCLRLPATVALRSVVALPIAAESNLDEAVAFEAERHTPFNPAEVHVTYRLRQRDVAAHRLAVELTILPRPVVNAALATIAAVGLRAGRIEVDAESVGTPPSRFILDQPREGEGLVVRRLRAAVAVLMISLAITAIYLPLQRAASTLDQIDVQLAEARQRGAEIARLSHQVAQFTEEAMFLVRLKQRGPLVSEILAELTRAMPDDTWLFELQLSGAEAQLAGYSGSASDLIGSLEQTRFFRNTAFRSPVTQDPVSRRERFHIAARVTAEGEK
jgi:general secretion pathway protein L